ncbi:hypothetical protein [Nostoc sp.]
MPDKKNVVIIHPVGAIEQHDPHLRLIVDAVLLKVKNPIY